MQKLKSILIAAVFYFL